MSDAAPPPATLLHGPTARMPLARTPDLVEAQAWFLLGREPGGPGSPGASAWRWRAGLLCTFAVDGTPCVEPSLLAGVEAPTRQLLGGRPRTARTAANLARAAEAYALWMSSDLARGHQMVFQGWAQPTEDGWRLRVDALAVALREGDARWSWRWRYGAPARPAPGFDPMATLL